jgi:hypothetical protein
MIPMSKPKNIFESICYKYISAHLDDEDMIFDAMCVALNNLPARYYRDEVCLSKQYMIAQLEDYRHIAEEACKRAIKFIQKHPRKPC